MKEHLSSAQAITEQLSRCGGVGWRMLIYRLANLHISPICHFYCLKVKRKLDENFMHQPIVENLFFFYGKKNGRRQSSIGIFATHFALPGPHYMRGLKWKEHLWSSFKGWFVKFTMLLLLIKSSISNRGVNFLTGWDQSRLAVVCCVAPRKQSTCNTTSILTRVKSPCIQFS